MGILFVHSYSIKRTGNIWMTYGACILWCVLYIKYAINTPVRQKLRELWELVLEK